MEKMHPFRPVGAVLLLFVFFCMAHDLQAQITGYDIFKTTLYLQTDDTQPMNVNAPDAYFFGAQFFASLPNDITNVSFTTPDDAMYSHDETNIYYVAYGSPYFATKEDMDAAFPDGDYLFEINGGEDSGTVTFPTNEFYSPDVPYFTGSTWDTLQMLDPNAPFTLTWNTFTPNEAGQGLIFLRIFDENANSFVYSSDALSPDTICTNFVGGTLKYATPYHVDLIFSTRITITGAGFSGLAESTAGFDVLTSVEFTTPAPVLSITKTGDCVRLNWPLAASDYSLESTHDLTGTNWCIVTNVPVTVDDQLVVTKPLCCTNTFFRLSR